MSGPTLVSRVVRRLGGRWAAPRRYATLGGWAADVYDEALKRLRGWPLPLRRALRRVRLEGGAAPYSVRLGTTDMDVLTEVYFRGEYEQVAQLDLGPSPLIVDLGSNIGLSIRFWKERWPQAEVLAVEPDAENAAVCRANASAAPGPPTRVFEVCIAGHARDVQLDRSRGEWGFSMLQGDAAPGAAGPGGGPRVEAITLEELLRRAQVPPERRIDLLKCDIEGAEQEVFAHCESWIGRVGAAVVELHAPYTRDRLLADLHRARAGFDCRVLKSIPGIDVVLLTRTPIAR